jgi:hypothetical protein
VKSIKKWSFGAGVVGREQENQNARAARTGNRTSGWDLSSKNQSRVAVTKPDAKLQNWTTVEKSRQKKDFLTQRVKRKLRRGNQILARANPWTQPESKSTQRQNQNTWAGENTSSTNQGGRRSTVAVLPSAGKENSKRKIFSAKDLHSTRRNTKNTVKWGWNKTEKQKFAS